ncbi:MAG: penicillin-binding transpeptidase domain-containing protein [Clostridia bacterium]
MGKLIYIQVFSSKELQIKATSQWVRDLPLIAERGNILDCNGVVLADCTTTYTIFVRPIALKQHENVAQTISKVCGLDYNALLAKIKRKGVSEITVAKHLTKTQLIEICNKDYSGVYFAEDFKRVYPYGNFLTQVLGFTDVDGFGQCGIEKQYNKFLEGSNGKILTETDLIGRELEGKTTKYLPSIEGQNVSLTIDYYIQSFAEKCVVEVCNKYKAKGAECLIMNPKNGEILAMAQAPSFDLNNIPRENVGELFTMSKNGMISNAYEPGSTFKILTSAIGMEEQAFDSNHRFYCPGYRMIDGTRIKCWKTIGHGTQTFEEGIKNSCNCVFMDIATKVGVKKMYQYFNKFGLGNITGVDLLGEAKGIMLNEKIVKPVDIARIGFGQAIAVTPIQLVNAVSGAINGGFLPKPHIVKEVLDKDGRIIFNAKESAKKQIISQKTSDDLRRYLEGVVTSGGGKNAYVNGYSIGGKTGTAQKYENGHIAQGKYVSSFLGFSSVDNPEYVILLTVDEPQGYVYYGSIVAAPFVADVFKNIFAYKNILPKLTQNQEQVAMPDLMDKSYLEAKELLKQVGLNFEFSGENGKIMYQVPAPNTQIDKNTIVFFRME